MANSESVTTNAKTRWFISLPFILVWAAFWATAYWCPFFTHALQQFFLSIIVLLFGSFYSLVFAFLTQEWCERGRGGIYHD